jgi:hypothetical protein
VAITEEFGNKNYPTPLCSFSSLPLHHATIPFSFPKVLLHIAIQEDFRVSFPSSHLSPSSAFLYPFPAPYLFSFVYKTSNLSGKRVESGYFWGSAGIWRTEFPGDMRFSGPENIRFLIFRTSGFRDLTGRTLPPRNCRRAIKISIEGSFILCG